jgi:hypothetical protein
MSRFQGRLNGLAQCIYSSKSKREGGFEYTQWGSDLIGYRVTYRLVVGEQYMSSRLLSHQAQQQAG